VAAGDAADFEYRTVTIVDGRFEPPEIDMPAGAALKLDFQLIGPQDTSVSIPSLGIGATLVPAKRVNLDSVKAGAGSNLRKMRLVLGPLRSGEYPVFCDCTGKTAAARLVVR